MQIWNRILFTTVVLRICCSCLAAVSPAQITCGVANLFEQPKRGNLASNADNILSQRGLPMQLFLPGKDSNTWAFSIRPRSSAEFVMAALRLEPGREIVFDLAPYSLVGNSWPELGKLFREPTDKEQADVAKEMEAKLGLPVRSELPVVKIGSELQSAHRAADEVLTRHGYPLLFIVDGRDCLWAVSAKPTRANMFQLAIIKMPPTGKLSIQLLSFMRISDWALLGRPLRGSLDEESQQIAAEIEAKAATYRSADFR